MKKEFVYGDFNCSYYLIYELRKSIRLTVYPNLRIVLQVPKNYQKDKIENFLKRKYLWITKQLNELKKIRRSTKEKNYISGESFLYLGRQYKLKVKPATKDRVYFEYGKIILETHKDIRDKHYNKELLEAWYKTRAKEVFCQRYKLMIKKFDYKNTPNLCLRNMDKRWGSFISDKKIFLNPELVKASKDCIDYVIIHELCHLKYKNHSKAYYRFLLSKCPNFKELKNKLELRFAGY